MKDYKVELNGAPIYWHLTKGMLDFYDRPSALFWLIPSLSSMVVPIVEEVGRDLFCLLQAEAASKGTHEDYNDMISKVSGGLKEGFLAWGKAVSIAGWGTFDLLELDEKNKKARVKIINSWELLLQKNIENHWGSPFMQGKLIGIFSHAFKTNCWADVQDVDYKADSPFIVLYVYPSNRTIKKEIEELRKLQAGKKEERLKQLVEKRTHDLEEAKKELALYSKGLEERVKDRTQKLEEYLEEMVEINAREYEQREKLKKLNATKDRFFSILAHDLKNPFNSIYGFSDFLLSSYSSISENDKLEYIQIIRDSSFSLIRFTENLLGWARSNTGDLKVVRKNVQLKSLVESVMYLLKSQALRKNIKLESDVNEWLEAYIDENMFSTVMRNLISNAIKYSYQGSVVKIEGKADIDEILICVKDNGVGIAEEDIDRLFNVEHRLKREGTNKEEGTGLGLILCRDFVEKNGGRIWVESKKGRGAKFCCTIPKAMQEEGRGEIY